MQSERLTELLNARTWPQWTANETAVGKEWLKRHSDDWDDVELNLQVGSVPGPQAGLHDATLKQMQINSAKRIDMLAKRGGYAAIVEAKVRVTLMTVGQLYGYRVLLEADRPTLAITQLWGIGVYAILDAALVFDQLDLSLELYPELILPEPTRVA